MHLGTSDEMPDSTQVESVKSPSGKAEIAGLPEILGGHPDMSKHWQEGTLILRKGKRRQVWYGIYRVPKYCEGAFKWVQVKKALGTLQELKTETAARRKLSGIVSEINSPDYRATSDVTFAVFAEMWVKSSLPMLKRSTQECYRSAIKKHLLPVFGSIKLREFNGMMIQEYVAKHPAHPLTVRNIIVTLRSMWGDAAKSGYAPKGLLPFDCLRMPKAEKRTEVPCFTEEQIKLILANAKEPHRTFFWLAAETGMRAGELCGLRVMDVEYKTGLVQVRQSVWRGSEQRPKTPNAVRSFTISAPLCSALELRSIGKSDTELLFAAASGRAWKASDVVTWKLHPLLVKLGIPKAGLHAFRHGVATMMDRMNTPLKTRQARLGHGSIALTLDRYSHAQSADDREAAEGISERVRVM